MTKGLAIIGAALLLAASPAAVWAQGAVSSAAFDADVVSMTPGQYIWNGDLAPAGPVTVIVHLPSQRAYVYRNGIRIGVATVSTGKAGHKTPTGVFTILQKARVHHSNLYNNAPMPYMQRLTWGGIALHAGNLPGYPASHGCVRMPMAFAKLLYDTTSLGMTVVITNDAVTPEVADRNAFLAPVDPDGTPDDPTARRLDAGAEWRWTPEKSPDGPVTIILSTANQRILVFRNGVEIGRSRIEVAKGFEIGTTALQYAGTTDDGRAKWIHVPLPGYQHRAGQVESPSAMQQIVIPAAFRKLVQGVIGPGTTVLATSGGMRSGSSGKATTVIATQ